MNKISLEEKLAQIREFWQPHVVGELNGQELKLARLKGEFDWHHHVAEDEAFLVLNGRLRICFRDHEVELGPGELVIVPRGVDHKPVAEEEVQVLLFEPAGTLNTGNLRNDRTVDRPKKI